MAENTNSFFSEGSMEQLTLQTSLNDRNDLHDDDIDFWGEDKTINNPADDPLLDREWKRRHKQFHTMGYREGISAGKEASAQEGFNVGFKHSARDGYNWGFVRGISSVYATLPHHQKENLGGALEKRERLQNLYQNVQAISTTDALKLFHESNLRTETKGEHSGKDLQLVINSGESSSRSQLDSIFKELTSLLHDLPGISMITEPVEDTSG